MLGTISGALARSLIYILQRWQARPGKKDTPGRRGAKPPDSIEQGAKPPVR